MKESQSFLWIPLLLATAAALPQKTTIVPQVRNQPAADHSVTVVELTAHFVTTIRVPEPVNSVVVGDPALFQVEHSEREPELVFVKALTTEASESNLLISTTQGRQISILLISHGRGPSPAKVDFLLRYQNVSGFLIEPKPLPLASIAQTTSLGKFEPPAGAGPTTNSAEAAATPISAERQRLMKPEGLTELQAGTLDRLLERQKQAPLPALNGDRMEGEEAKTGLRTGISEVLDSGQQVIVLFSVVNASKHTALLMPPQIQLAGRRRSGKLIKRERWSTAEQLAVIDSRLSTHRIAPGERADGVVMFERPPFKQSTETLFLQMAESGAVDKPALAPIGFGVSTVREATSDTR